MYDASVYSGLVGVYPKLRASRFSNDVLMLAFGYILPSACGWYVPTGISNQRTQLDSSNLRHNIAKL